MRALILSLLLPAAAHGAQYLEQVASPVYASSATAAALAAQGRECLGRVLQAGDVGAAPDGASATCTARFSSLLVPYEARSRLTFAARDGGFQLTHDRIVWRQANGTAPFAKVGEWLGSGWKDVRAALLARSEEVARCVRSGVAPPAQTPAFERLKSLAGSWTATDRDGKTSRDAFELAARGTAVLEKNDGFVALYHLDGESILLTLATEEGVQTRLRAAPGSLAFSYLDSAGAAPDAGRMTALSLELETRDRLVETWSWTEKGKTTPLRLTLTR